MMTRHGCAEGDDPQDHQFSLGKNGEPPGTRTPNPQIKSLLLYQLS